MSKTEREKSSLGDRGLDMAAQYAIGINNAVKGLTDLLGPDNPASRVLEDNVQWYRDLLSATALGNEEEIARIMKEAEDKGVLEQLSAAGRAFGTAPADLVASGLGSLTTFAVGGAAGRAAGLGTRGVAAAQSALGAGMQAGIVKNEIYLGVRQEMVSLGKTEQEAEAIAREAQSYSGKNLDQILIGAGLGGVDGLTGAQRIIGRALMRGGLDHGASRVASVLGNGLAESTLEAAQGGQERLSANVGMSREGVETGMMRGVAASAGLEGIVGGVIGGGVASVEPRSSRPPSPSRPPIVQDSQVEATPSPAPVAAPAPPATGSAPEKAPDPAPAPVPRQTPAAPPENAPPAKNEADPQKIGMEKARLLGVEEDPVGSYIAANYPELSKKAKTPAEFAANTKSWRSKLEQEIESGKHLNKKVGTGDFVQRYGYEPSPSEYATLLENHRRKQVEIQQGWVSYLRDGGYSDKVSALILNTITKETAYRVNGTWRFQKLGGSSNSLPPAADPELAARFSNEFRGDRKPSQVLSEIKSEIASRTALEGASKKNMLLTRGEISWIRFPSKEHDPEGFDENVKSLTDISLTVEEFGCTKWCCAHGKASDFLTAGDFYAGLDTDGRARLGVRMEGDQVKEVRGVLHSQAVEPGLAPQLKKFIDDQSLSGDSIWVDDASIKGKVASLAAGGTWADLKKVVGREDDTLAAEFVHSYRGPSGAYDFLVGADNDHVQRVVWEKLSPMKVSPLNMMARAGSFSQAKGWVDGSVLDTPRPAEFGGGQAIHALFADNEGMSYKAPPLLREWGLLTPERQRATDADLNNIWHIQAGGRGNALARATGGPEKSDLLTFLDWPGIDEESLFAPNKDLLTPMHLCFAKQTAPLAPHGLRDLDTYRGKVVEAFRLHGDGPALLHDNGGKWKHPLIFSAAEGGMLSEVIDAGLVSPDEISAVTDPLGNTPWHRADFGDIRRLVDKGHMKPAHMGLANNEGVTVAELICRRPGGFTLLVESNLIDESNVAGLGGTRVSLAHSAAVVGEAERAMESGLFRRSELVKPSWDAENNFLHLWGSRGIRAPSVEKLRQMVAAAGISPVDFERVNKENENAYRFFAESPSGLEFLAKADLVTSEGIATRGGARKDTPLHKLPPHSLRTYHLLAEKGILSRTHMMTENSHGEIPLHQYIRDEFNGGDGIEGVKRMASVLGLRPEDFVSRHGVDGRDALDVVRKLRRERRELDGPIADPLPEFCESGLVDRETIFRQRHGQGVPAGIESRTATQKKMALTAWGRSPFEDSVRNGGPEAFARLMQMGAVTPERMSRSHGEGSEWSNYTEFVMHSAADEPGWMPAVTEAIESGVVGRAGLSVEARSKPGPVYLRFIELPSYDPMMSALEKGSLAPSDLVVEGGADRRSILSGVCRGSTGEGLSRLIEGGHVEPGALSRISIPYGLDSGNPARYLLERKPELFDIAARKGLFDRQEAVFGRDGFSAPIALAFSNGAMSSFADTGLLSPEILENAQGMRRVWVSASEEGSALGLARALVKGGASREQVRRSLTKVEGDDRSAISSFRARGAAGSLADLASEGFVVRDDIAGAGARNLLGGVLSDDPAGLGKLVGSGLLAPGDLYSGRFGKDNLVRSAVSMARDEGEEVRIVRALAKSGILGKEDAANLAGDLCYRPKGSAGLREAVDQGIVGRKELSSTGEDGKSALDILLGRASVTAARRGDLAFLLKRGLVPREYEGRVVRGSEGRFSAVVDAVERVTDRLQGLLSAGHPPKNPVPLPPSVKMATPRVMGEKAVSPVR